MSQLRVNNNMLEYEGTTYNILQINSTQVIEIKGKKTVSFKFLKYTIPVSLIFCGLAYVITYHPYAVTSGFLGFGLFLFSIVRTYSLIKNKFFQAYGLSFKMANGENPVFISSNKNLLFKIKDGINNAINQENASINFGNVNIDVSNSSDVNIGSIVKR